MFFIIDFVKDQRNIYLIGLFYPHGLFESSSENNPPQESGMGMCLQVNAEGAIGIRGISSKSHSK